MTNMQAPILNTIAGMAYLEISAWFLISTLALVLSFLKIPRIAY